MEFCSTREIAARICWTLRSEETSSPATNNTGSGINITGRHGLFDEATGIATPLYIGREGHGNTLASNNLSGLRVTGTGQIGFTDNIVRGSNTERANNQGGIYANSNDLLIAIKNSRFESNIGKGIDIESTGQISATIRDSIITTQITDGGQIGDGIELQSTNSALDILATNNFIDSNAGRGIDVLNRGSGRIQSRFGDGTIAGQNTIVGNNLEGFYVVNTADAGQVQDGT